MTNKIIIGLIAVMLIFAGNGTGEKMLPLAVEEEVTQEKETVKFKCDPCDYNIDFGDTQQLGEKGGIDEGFVKIECDLCDYNIDYGYIYYPLEK